MATAPTSTEPTKPACKEPSVSPEPSINSDVDMDLFREMIECEYKKRTCSRRASAFYKKVYNEERMLKKLDSRALLMSQKNFFVVREKRELQIAQNLREILDEEHLTATSYKRLRLNCPELRTLKSQLGAAETCKKLVEQKWETVEREAVRLTKRARDHEKYAKEYQCFLNDENDRIRLEHEQKQEYGEYLMVQVAEVKERQRLEKEQLLRERRSIDELMAKYAEMDEEELVKAHEKKIRVRTELHQMMEEKRAQQEAADQQDEQENVDSLEEQDRRAEARLEAKREKQRQLDAKAALSYRIGSGVKKIRDDHMEREMVLEDLLIQEKRHLGDVREAAENNDMMLYRRQLNMELHESNAANESRKQITHELELARRKATDAELSELIRQETIARQEKKLQNRLEVRAALSDAMARRNYEREREVAEIEALEQMRKREEDERQRAIEIERIRIMREQPIEVLEYVKLGIISPAERRELGLDKEDTPEPEADDKSQD